MAWWLTVYCRESVAAITDEQLAVGLRGGDPSAPAGVDYFTLAEDYELDEAVVEAALEQLAVVRIGDAPLDIEIRYREQTNARPIVVHLWQEPERVAEEIQEALEVREPPDGALAWVRACREVVGIELGFSQLEDMGLVIAVELARYLAQKGDGVIVDDEHEWFAVEDGGFVDP